jgi:hypothetical protein
MAGSAFGAKKREGWASLLGRFVFVAIPGEMRGFFAALRNDQLFFLE